MPRILLQNIPLFSSLSAHDLSEISRSMHLKTLLDGEILFRENDVGNSFYIVTLGKIEVVKALETPEERLLNALGPGEFMGELSIMIPDNLRTASVRAVGETQVLELHRDRFKEMIETRPNIAYQVMQKLSERLQASDESTINDLRKKNAELALAYQDLKTAQAELIEKEKFDHELNMAREIQMSILPQKVILPEGCDIGAKMVPAKIVGGDFYDIIPMDNSRVGIAIGDVSDKGIAAAMFMAQFCTLLRVEAKEKHSPKKVLAKINNHLLERNHSGLFVTCLYGIYDNLDHSFSYARAGHEIPLIIDQKGNLTQPEYKKGAALCLFDDPPVDVNTVFIPPGSTLLMYTDGATDAMNDTGKLFGFDNLKQTILNSLNSPVQELCEQIIKDLVFFQKNTQFDDITIVALRNLKNA